MRVSGERDAHATSGNGGELAPVICPTVFIGRRVSFFAFPMAGWNRSPLFVV